jgi:integrase
LTLPEIEELLRFVLERGHYGFLYPMVIFAAHTGARRSEMMRSRINDIDFSSNTVLIREKKRAKGKRTTRRVPMSPKLAAVMRDWLASHPGGLYTFCHDALHIPQSNKTRTALTGLTKDEVSHHLRLLLADSKWERIRGWHVFRHSFASNCASLGVDQRLIDEWLGHQTDDMRKRYRHLLPDHQQKSIDLVFGA